jgi:hypothetical protein
MNLEFGTRAKPGRLRLAMVSIPIRDFMNLE